jgi:serine/threonine protein kinase/tetratricopeptide (TPR) repeat protein
VLAETLDAIESVGSSALVDACRRHPELAAGLRRRLGLLAAANLLELTPELAGVPARLGDFEPKERLGDGAMGVVYRALQTSTGRDVALKVVRGELLIFPEARLRFRREVELSARLHHTSIVPVLAVGEADGATGSVPWFAMELVRGASLAALLDGLRARFGSASAIDPAAVPETLAQATPESLRGTARLPAPRSWWSWALATALSAARAVAHAHEKGVLHRDVKPSNVLVGADGRVYLTDFGLAGDLAGGDASLTRSRGAVGTLAYMAPEVLEGAGADARSDVYGLGALAYELLTLRRPFEAPTSAALMRAILDSAPLPPRRHAPALGPDEEAVVLRALERDPHRRYATAYELALDLERLIERRPTLARPAGPWLRARRLVERRPAASAAVALGFLLVVGTPSVVAWSQARARAHLEDVNRDLDDALARERAGNARADENLDRAARAVDALLTETSEVLLEEVPMMQTLKRDLLERALVILNELAPQEPTSPQGILQAAGVELAAGMARLDLGEADAGRRHLAAGLARLDACPDCAAFDAARTRLLRLRLLRQLARAEEHRDRAEAERWIRAALALPGTAASGRLLKERLLSRLALHDLEYSAGRIAAARAALDEAAAELEDEGELLTDRDRLWIRAKLLGMRGTKGYLDNFDDPASAADLRTALADLAEICRLNPEAMSAHADALGLGVNLGAVELRMGALDAAEAALAGARAEGERLVGLFPRARKYRTDLAALLINLGLVRQARGDVAGCREAWTAAADAGRELANEPEPTADALMQAGLALGNLASVERGDERYDESIAAASEGEAYLRRALALRPGHVLIARSLEFALLTRGNCLLSLGGADEARAAFAEAEAVAPPERLAQRALVDSWLELAKVSDGAARAELLDHALDVLRKAVELGWSARDDLENNPDFEPLRALPGFPTLD